MRARPVGSDRAPPRLRRLYAQCDQADSDQGGPDGLTDNYENTHPPLDPNLRDTDGDGFDDGEEVLPTGVPGCGAGGGLNIRLLGASPTRPDIFVEFDWMQAADHTHQPIVGALEDVIAAFNTRGITLHLDTGVAPFNLGGGSQLAHQQGIGFGFSDASNPLTFEAFKAANFNSRTRCNVFHYSIFGHFLETTVSSGAGEICGDDFMVTLGSAPDQMGTRLWQAGTFMHELGHNLGLRHGGNADLPQSKPNYRSVMNRRWQFRGIDTNCDNVADAVVDYSDELLDSLDENSLDERVGVCVVGAQCFGGPGECNNGGPTNCVGIDWNGDGDCQDAAVGVNLTTPDGDRTILTGWNDWANLAFCLGGGGGASPPETIECPEITP